MDRHEEQGVREIREFRTRVESNGTEEKPLPDPVESFRRGWAEAMTQEGRPVQEFWNDLDAENL